ncbi:MAG: hypothetical protein ACXV5T_09875 [Halobacteriota archaeon]
MERVKKKPVDWQRISRSRAKRKLDDKLHRAGSEPNQEICHTIGVDDLTLEIRTAGVSILLGPSGKRAAFFYLRLELIESLAVSSP